jgi:lipopolysaccharide transport system permease protein
MQANELARDMAAVERLSTEAISAVETGGADNSAAIAGKVVHVIEAGRSRVPVDLQELWSHRELLYFLAWRDIKLRYKQTVLGATWAILQPFLTMVVFTLLFGRLAHVPSEGLPYPIFVYAGLLPWTFFNSTVSSSATSLIGNSSLITKIYFPRMMIPGATVVAGLLDFAIAGALLGGMFAYYGISLTWNLLALPALVILMMGFALAVGLWMAALNVKYRDVRYALPFLLQLWLYVTPVIYPVSFIPEHFRWLLRLNPLTGIIDGYRNALFGTPFDWTELAVAAVLTLACMGYALRFFRQLERQFADIV